MWVLADGTVWLYGLGFALWAFGESLRSGTQEAVLFEHIHNARFGRLYEKVVGRDKAVEEVGGWSGILFGGFIAHFSMELAIWLSVVPLFGASFMALWLTDARDSENGGTDEGDARPTYLQNFGNALREFRDRPRLRFLTLYLTFGVNLFWIWDEFTQLFYLEPNRKLS